MPISPKRLKIAQVMMTILNTRANFQSVEIKLDFIRLKLTDIWPFEVLIFFENIIEKLMVLKGLPKGQKMWKMLVRGDFFHFFTISLTINVDKRDSGCFPPVSFEICLIH